ncbi:uncharacterized protein BXZ73DRAFT_99965 [Epithele typhae]|uniref:uncharacterized protein n=1 Tax=Epithele typhae TaxID=378194 RepID=UPI002007F56B|nr:uncharacterized protein BXZ73DRAFT_99965 [Epithele typhae]KAH9938902.1 hypothetical protein BXZ73DRAFT_99965 [Epithele typhae]
MDEDGTAAAASLEQYHNSMGRILVIRRIMSSTLSGVVMVLSALSFTLLWRRGIQHRGIKALFAATVILSLSTTLFFAVSIVATFATDDIIYRQSMGLSVSPVRARLVDAMTLVVVNTLGINVGIGDAVVLWRTVALWSYKPSVNAVAGVLGLGILVSGIVAQVYACSAFKTASQGPVPFPYQLPGYLEVEPAFVVILFSLLANTVSTTLIAAKTWMHWKTVRHVLAARGFIPRAFHLLLLLIETGILYSLCWVLIAAFYGFHIVHPSETGGLFDVAGRVFILSCVVPLVAIYPMSIIVLFAAKQSPLEEATMLTSVPLSLHAVTFHDHNTVVSTESKDGSEPASALAR